MTTFIFSLHLLIHIIYDGFVIIVIMGLSIRVVRFRVHLIKEQVVFICCEINKRKESRIKWLLFCGAIGRELYKINVPLMLIIIFS